MKYLICQQWDNLRGNHAGFPHICHLLEQKYPDQYVVIEKSTPTRRRTRKNKFSRLLFKYIDNRDLIKRNYEEYILLCSNMFQTLREGDEVFLLEYNLPIVSQYELAKYIRNNFKGVRLYALSHLTPSYFEKDHVRKKIVKWDSCIDKQLTLGSSLSQYLKGIGIKPQKISTGFHAVDLNYYSSSNENIEIKKERLTIISIGALQRNYNLLSKIVNRCDDVNWIICAGRKHVTGLFPKQDNVKILGYLEESELRYQMSQADLALNVMEDTVGSNVITTSMAMGLGIIVSDVGSIHDYCNDRNALFCDNDVESFVSAINFVVLNHSMVMNMKRESLNIIRKFSIENTHKWFCSLK